jgi:hypothetical protein
VGYSIGYWAREGMGRLGLDALIAAPQAPAAATATPGGQGRRLPRARYR